MPKYNVFNDNMQIIAKITAPDMHDAHNTLEKCGIKYYCIDIPPVPNTEMPTTQTLFKFNVYDHNDFNIGVVKAVSAIEAHKIASTLYRNVNHVAGENTTVTPQQVFDPIKNGPETIYDFSAHAGKEATVTATASPGLYTQQFGRGTRIKPVQIHCTIIHMRNNEYDFIVKVGGKTHYAGFNLPLVECVAECNRYTKLLGGV